MEEEEGARGLMFFWGGFFFSPLRLVSSTGRDSKFIGILAFSGHQGLQERRGHVRLENGPGQACSGLFVSETQSEQASEHRV